MLTYVVGDIFQSPAHVLVNTVNTVGIMGKGIAKTFKQVYPEMFERYRQLCDSEKLTVGKVWLYKTPNKWILNFPTKTTWRKPSRLEYIEKGLNAFVRGYAERGITSIAFPALGCGNGELNWEKQVRPLMEKYLKPLPIDIFIYVYKKGIGIPEHKNVKATTEWLRSEPETLGFSEVWIDIKKIADSEEQLRSFYNGQPFRFQILDKDAGIRIDTGSGVEQIHYEELLDFWNVIRLSGFGIPASVPPGTSPYTDFLLTIFEKLPYCREIVANKDYSALSSRRARGLQFFPRSAQVSSLFNGSPKRLIAV